MLQWLAEANPFQRPKKSSLEKNNISCFVLGPVLIAVLIGYGIYLGFKVSGTILKSTSQASLTSGCILLGVPDVLSPQDGGFQCGVTFHPQGQQTKTANGSPGQSASICRGPGEYLEIQTQIASQVALSTPKSDSWPIVVDLPGKEELKLIISTSMSCTLDPQSTSIVFDFAVMNSAGVQQMGNLVADVTSCWNLKYSCPPECRYSDSPALDVQVKDNMVYVFTNGGIFNKSVKDLASDGPLQFTYSRLVPDGFTYVQSFTDSGLCEGDCLGLLSTKTSSPDSSFTYNSPRLWAVYPNLSMVEQIMDDPQLTPLMIFAGRGNVIRVNNDSRTLSLTSRSWNRWYNKVHWQPYYPSQAAYISWKLSAVLYADGFVYVTQNRGLLPSFLYKVKMDSEKMESRIIANVSFFDSETVVSDGILHPGSSSLLYLVYDGSSSSQANLVKFSREAIPRRLGSLALDHHSFGTVPCKLFLGPSKNSVFVSFKGSPTLAHVPVSFQGETSLTTSPSLWSGLVGLNGNVIQSNKFPPGQDKMITLEEHKETDVNGQNSSSLQPAIQEMPSIGCSSPRSICLFWQLGSTIHYSKSEKAYGWLDFISLFGGFVGSVMTVLGVLNAKLQDWVNSGYISPGTLTDARISPTTVGAVQMDPVSEAEQGVNKNQVGATYAAP